MWRGILGIFLLGGYVSMFAIVLLALPAVGLLSLVLVGPFWLLMQFSGVGDMNSRQVVVAFILYAILLICAVPVGFARSSSARSVAESRGQAAPLMPAPLFWSIYIILAAITIMATMSGAL